MTVAATARTWQATPSSLLGLEAGSLEAWTIDRRLAERVLEAEQEELERRQRGDAGVPPSSRTSGGVNRADTGGRPGDDGIVRIRF